MRWCPGALVLLLGLTACGGPPRPRRLAPVERHDDAVALAALLPDGVERCVVARPRRLSERRRSLALLQSWAEPEAYDADLPIVAYATAQAEGYGGRRARRTYLRFSEAADVERHARALPVRWLDEPCEGIECRRPVARWMDPRTLEIARYEWPRREMPASSAGCVELARAAPDAFEVGVDAGRRMGGLPTPTPRVTRRILRVERGALTTRRELVFRDPIEARVFESYYRGREDLIEASLMPLGPSRRTFEREGERVVISDQRLWEELELALEDEQLRRRALTLGRERARPAPLSRVDFENLAVVRHQLRLRQAELAHLGSAERAEAAETLATLLERAVAEHPAEIELVRVLVRLELDPLDRPTRAVEAIERVLASGVAEHPPEWRLLRREALSHQSAAALASALEVDGVTERRAARAAAEDLVALRQGGVPYEWAEGAWQLSRALESARRPRHRVSARLPLEGALGALVGYARIHRGDAPVTVQIAVRAPALGPARAVGESRPELVVVRGPGAGATVVGALASGDLIALRRLGHALVAVVPPGPVELAIELRTPDGAHVERLRVAGERQGDDLVLERTNAPLRDAPWAALGRYLARPLAELPTALFPPPELTVRAESAEAAAELRRAAEPLVQGACRVAGPILRCRSVGRPEQLGELLLRVARTRLQ